MKKSKKKLIIGILCGVSLLTVVTAIVLYFTGYFSIFKISGTWSYEEKYDGILVRRCSITFNLDKNGEVVEEYYENNKLVQKDIFSFNYKLEDDCIILNCNKWTEEREKKAYSHDYDNAFRLEYELNGKELTLICEHDPKFYMPLLRESNKRTLTK